jgi:uncharacterized protein YneF (UPF0154 family)
MIPIVALAIAIGVCCFMAGFHFGCHITEKFQEKLK